MNEEERQMNDQERATVREWARRRPEDLQAWRLHRRLERAANRAGLSVETRARRAAESFWLGMRVLGWE